MKCITCNGDMTGDAYTSALHCEYAEPPEDAEADSGPWYCAYEDEPDAFRLPATVEFTVIKGVIEK